MYRGHVRFSWQSKPWCTRGRHLKLFEKYGGPCLGLRLVEVWPEGSPVGDLLLWTPRLPSRGCDFLLHIGHIILLGFFLYCYLRSVLVHENP